MHIVGLLSLIVIIIYEKFFMESKSSKKIKQYEKEQNERLGIEPWEVRFNKLK